MDHFLIDRLNGGVPGVRDAEGRGRRAAVRQAVGRAVLRIRDGPPRRPPIPPLLPRAARGPQGRLATPRSPASPSRRTASHWTKPELGLFEVDGSKANNVILAGHGAVLAQLLPDDRHPRRRAEGRTLQGPGRDVRRAAWSRSSRRTGCAGASSAKRRSSPRGAFDSQNVPFWSEHEQCYLCYFRVFKDGFRRIARTSSTDFLTWTSRC